MKRVLSLMLVLVCFVLLLAGCGDKTKTENVTVTIVDKNGEAVLALEKVKAKDLDGDDKITIYEALKAAHATCPNGGADGFVTEVGQYGLSMVKLWGEENGGAFGYFVNEASAWSLADEVQPGDRIVAFSYTDTAGYTDRLSYFTPITAKVNAGETVTLTLTALIPDESWNNVPTTIAGAKIFVNGTDSGLTTDAEGNVTLTLSAGVNEITATSETIILVPPIAFITVE